jgi:hypothetical protein
MRDLGYNTYMFTATIYTPDGNMMISTEIKILVEEEYGYRYWSWTPNETTFSAVENLVEATRQQPKVWRDIYFKDITKFGGEWTLLSMPEGLTEEDEDKWVDENLGSDDYHAIMTLRQDPEDSRILWNVESV